VASDGLPLDCNRIAPGAAQPPPRPGERHRNAEIPSFQQIRLNLSVGAPKALLYWALYQGTALAVPPNWEKSPGFSPCQPRKGTVAKAIDYRGCGTAEAVP
jgi:hypothetical protein